MRYILSVDFEEDSDIEAFLRFVKYHSRRLKCPAKDVFLRLAQEWERQFLEGEYEPGNGPGAKKKEKKTVKETA